MEDLKKLKVNNWEETAKDRRTWRDLTEKGETHKGLQCHMIDWKTLAVFVITVYG